PKFWASWGSCRAHARVAVLATLSREFPLRSAFARTTELYGTRRLYSVDVQPRSKVDAWLGQRFWQQPLDALATEIARGARAPPSKGARRHAPRVRRS